MKRIKILVAALLSLATFSLTARTSVGNLKTDWQTTPLGIETATPLLSWQMLSDAKGASQTAYRIVAALTERQLGSADYCYDSGKVSSDVSVGIPYQGTLAPATRYWWKVLVWDNAGKQSESPATWFETGLCGLGWSGAQWIGSGRTILSKYRTDFVIDYDVKICDDEAVFVFGAKDERNYVTCHLDKSRLSFGYVSDGKETITSSADLSGRINSDASNHHLRLDVACSGGKNYSVSVQLDGQKVVPSSNDEAVAAQDGMPSGTSVENPFLVNIHGFNENTNLDRLGLIGIDQPSGQKAVFRNITVGERRWGTTFVRYEEKVSDGGLQLWDPTNASAPMLRKVFSLRDNVSNARLYATSRGIHEIEINGRAVSDSYYNPGWTVYNKRIFYNTYDVTSLLQKGANAIGAVLGAGWWNDFVGMSTDPYGVNQSLMAKLVVTYADGSVQTFVTDDSWKVCDDGPVVANGMQTGEEYDARREIAGWSEAGFREDAGWRFVKIYDAPKSDVEIQAYVGEPIRCHEVLTARSVSEPVKGTYIYDMGVNMVGIPQISHLNGRAGQRVCLRFAEMLWPEVIPENPVSPYTVKDYENNRGQMYTDNYRGALSRDVYFMKGTGDETFTPSLAQHGYRYIEITGLDAPLALEDVKGLVLHSVGEQTSSFETSDPLVNQLFSNIVWGQRGNFLSVPTDCPQRDERMGWTGDAQVFARTATYNMMTDAFYNRWLYSLRDNQGSNGSYPMTAPAFSDGGDAMGWMEAGIIVPWQVYQQYGDVRILEDHYESMSRYMKYLGQRANGFIQPGGIFGDWLAFVYTDVSLTNTAYYGYDASIMARVARLLGKEDDAKAYEQLFADIKAAWNKTFVDSEGYTKYADGAPRGSFMGDLMGKTVSDPEHPERINTQTSYAVPLYTGVVSEENRARMAEHLAEAVKANGYVLNTGFIGTPYICTVLSDNGYCDVAYRLFEQQECPSWLFPVLQGATTIWERWNSYTLKEGFGPVGMNSFNHYSYGAIEEWIMSRMLGIERDEESPAYKHFYLRPQPGGSFEYARGGFESMYGRISSSWEKNSKGGYTYRCTVPTNTTATLILDGAPRELKAGTYTFRIK